METMEQKMARYQQVKDAIQALETQKKTILDEFKGIMSAGNLSELLVNVDDKTFAIKAASRTTHGCQEGLKWDDFIAAYPAVYAEFFRPSVSNYLDIRERVVKTRARRAQTQLTVAVTPVEVTPATRRARRAA